MCNTPGGRTDIGCPAVKPLFTDLEFSSIIRPSEITYENRQTEKRQPMLYSEHPENYFCSSTYQFHGRVNQFCRKMEIYKLTA